MMNDRELLELAARAAGITSGSDCHIPSGGIWVSQAGLDKIWNPLADDGDAIRLAVVLELDLNLGQGGTLVYMRRGTPNIEELSDDYMSAFRRAIVRAAAEIGRGME